MGNEDVRKVACASPLLPPRDLPESLTLVVVLWELRRVPSPQEEEGGLNYLGHLSKTPGLECTSGKGRGSPLPSKGVAGGGGWGGVDRGKVLPVQHGPPPPPSTDTPPSIGMQDTEEHQASADQGSENKITSFISKNVGVGKQHDKN